jgi:hypothetical protein
MNTTDNSQPKETFEQWRLRKYGTHGSIREALTRVQLKLFCARYDREKEREITRLAERVAAGSVGQHLARAAKAQRKEVRTEAQKLIWWALVAQVRIATGARLT